MKRAFFDSPEGQIHYRYDGVGEPSVLMFHQTPRSSAEYLGLLPLIAKKRRAIAVDTIGYGDSDKPPEDKFYRIEDYARIAIGLMDSLKIKKAVVVGHHTGSKTAAEMAAAYPERIDKLVMLGAYYWKEADRKLGVSSGGLWGEVAGKMDGSHLLDIWQRDVAAEDASIEIKNRSFLDNLKAGIGTIHRGHFASASYRQEERLPLIKCPTLVIWGSQDRETHDRIGFHTKGIAESIRNCKVAVVEGGGLYMPDQKPAELARLILDFIDAK